MDTANIGINEADNKRKSKKVTPFNFDVKSTPPRTLNPVISEHPIRFCSNTFQVFSDYLFE